MTFAHAISIGGLMEFGTSPDLEGSKPSIEILASYRFGRSDPGTKVIEPEVEKVDALALANTQREEAQRKAGERARIQKERDSLEQVGEKQKTARLERELHRKDSPAQIAQQRRKDSVAALESQKVVLHPRAGKV